MSKSSKAVGKDGTLKNQHTLTRTHTPGSFRVKQTWPVPPSLPLARRTQSDPLPASRKTHHSDCTFTVPTSSCNKFSRTSPRASTADPAVRPPQILRCAERQTRVNRAAVETTDRSKSLFATLRAVPSKSSNLNRADGKDGTPQNLHASTRNHTSRSFRVKQTLPMPLSLPWAHRTLSDPLSASHITNNSGSSTVAVSSPLLRGRAWTNDSNSASTMPISLNSSSLRALRNGRTNTGSTLSELYNIKFFYRDPRQVDTADTRRLKIKLRTRLIENVKSQHYGAFNRDVGS